MREMKRHWLFVLSVLATGTFAAAASAQASTMIVGAGNGLCVADPGYSASLYTQFVQWSCDGGSDDTFEATLNSDGTYSFKNDASRLCLDVLSWATNSGAAIGQYTCNGQSNQSFILTSVSSGVYSIKSKSSGLCLSFNGSNYNGTGLVQETCGGAGQTFKVTVSTPAPSPSPSPSPTPTASPAPSPSPSPSPSPPATSPIPSNAITVSNIQNQTNWIYKSDPATSGSAYGDSYTVSSPSLDGYSRKFYTTFSSNGGELYSVNFGNDTTSTHFVYDTYLYLANPSANANIEMDLNQVMSNGQTVIFGVQCAGWDKTWDYTVNSSGKPHWLKSNVPCDPRNWSANTWHHIQIASHRDNSGNVTYDWVSVDGNQQALKNQAGTGAANGYSAFSLGWGIGHLVMNFQIDGYGTGNSTTYTDKTTTYRW